MSGGITAAGVAATAAVGSLALSTVNSFRGGGGYGDVEMPSFYQDPNYEKTQDYMYDYGTGILEGEIPDYYKSIGEYGGQEFEDIMALVNRDVTQGAMETAARRGQKGGNVQQAVAKQTADASTKLRYQDFVRAMAGRESLFKGGGAMVSDVGSKALINQGQRNQFNLASVGMEVDMLADARAQDTASANRWASMVGSIGSGIGTAAGIYAGRDQGLNSATQDSLALSLSSANAAMDGGGAVTKPFNYNNVFGSAEIDPYWGVPK